MSLFQIQIVRMVEVTERQEPKLWCGFAVILIKAKPVVPVTDIVNSADKVTKKSVVWRKRWKRRQKCKNSNCWASHQITDPGGCSSHWWHVFELQTRGWFFDTFPSVRQNTWKLRLVRNSSAPWPPLIWCGEVTKDGGESIKIQPKKWSQWNNSAPLHQTPKRFPHSDSKVTTVTTRGLKKSPSSVLWKVIVSVLFWYLLLLYNLFFSLQNWKALKYRWNVYIQLQPVISRNK